jgi:hypothetical protein
MSIAAPTSPSPFSKKADNSESGSYEQPPVGLHPAVLIGLIDLGTHRSDMPNDKGEFPEVRKFFYIWELSAEKNKDGDSFLVGNSYTDSLHKKSAQRAMVEGWLGRSLGDSEEFDPLSLVGRECLINLASDTTKGGKEIVKIKAISPPMKGMTVPPATWVPPIVFHLSQIHSSKDLPSFPDDDLPRVFGVKILDVIRKSKEFQALAPF